jgi:2-polyprenyl-6-hydroxyphenyl methylase/3-demethylubiquinone-9 3-methyltransferase
MTRFDFGENWVSFSRTALNKERFNRARTDFKDLFSGIPLKGKTFLDVGFGQGLSLLLARESGAEVTGCDVNPKCVDAIEESARVLNVNSMIPVVIGSILSDSTVSDLATRGAKDGFDIVHSWGVLHHTGNMGKALENACKLVAPGGYFVLAIYNKHWSSPLWKVIKRVYCSSPRVVKRFAIWFLTPVIFTAKLLVTRHNPFHQQRGMEFMHNVIDWIGGYPYEYASVEEIVRLLSLEGFRVMRIIEAEVPTGCNQFTFKKVACEKFPNGGK